MKLLLRISIIILFISSIIATVMGIKVYRQGIKTKVRTQSLERAHVEIAQQLKMEGAANYTEDLKNPSRRQSTLNRIKTVAQGTRTQVEECSADLEKANSKYASLEGSINTSQNEITTAREETSQAKALAQKKTLEATRAKEKAEEVVAQLDGKNEEISSLKNQVAEKNDALALLEDEIASKDQQIDDLVKKIAVEQGTENPELEGLLARVIELNQVWNFVVLDVGSKNGVVANAQALIYRKDQLIGKAKISLVQDKYAVADLLMDWKKGSVRIGDSVLF